MLAVAPLLDIGSPALAIGDPTIANFAMAAVTAMLPAALVASIWSRWRAGLQTRSARVDFLVLAAVLHWCVVLAVWGLLPLRLWR